MTTLAELIQNCQNLINDTESVSFFTTQQYSEWINMAIQELNLYFPRLLEYEVTTTLNTRIYDLETNFLAVLSVEYPAGEDPPVYLKRKDHKSSDFWGCAGYYDLYKPFDADSDNPPQIYISEKPAADETILIQYQCMHNALSDSNDVATIPDYLTHLVPQFVRWKAIEALSTHEGMFPDPLKPLVASTELNAARAERLFRNALQSALRAQSESGMVAWGMTPVDRVY